MSEAFPSLACRAWWRRAGLRALRALRLLRRKGGVGRMMKAVEGGVVVVGLSEVWEIVEARGDRLVRALRGP